MEGTHNASVGLEIPPSRYVGLVFTPKFLLCRGRYLPLYVFSQVRINSLQLQRELVSYLSWDEESAEKLGVLDAGCRWQERTVSCKVLAENNTNEPYTRACLQNVFGTCRARMVCMYEGMTSDYTVKKVEK